MQVAKAERAVAGSTPVKRTRFVQLTGGSKSVDSPLEAKARSLAGVTNPAPEVADSAVVIGDLRPAVPDREVLLDTALQLLCFAPAGRRIALVTVRPIQFITPDMQLLCAL